MPNFIFGDLTNTKSIQTKATTLLCFLYSVAKRFFNYIINFKIKYYESNIKFLRNTGFSIKDYDENYFTGHYESKNGIEITVFYCDSVLGMKADNNNFPREIFNSFEIKSIDELIYLLSRNVFFKSQFQTLYEEMIQLQTSLTVKQA